MEYYLGIDLGASSGRAIIGYLENNEIKLEEIYRFNSKLETYNGHLTWNIDLLFKEILEGIRLAFIKYKNIKSLAIDTWGVDYVLLNNDKIIYPAYAYRDSRTKDVIDKVHSLIPFNRLYEITGIQFMEFNTIYQLYDDKLNGRLDNATDFLMIPEFFNYLLTGNKVKEFTDESTTGLVDAYSKNFSDEIITKLGLKKELFKKLEQPGYFVGRLKKEVQDIVGGDLDVILCPSHDTASAFDAIETPENSVFISSGTWSILGCKLKVANTSTKAFKANFSNEGGVGYTRFLKNITGMWVVNGVKNKYNIPITEVTEIAKTSSYVELFDVNDDSLTAPIDMEQAITNLLAKDGKPLPSRTSDIYNSFFHSLAYSYSLKIKEMEEILNTKFTSLYIVGGGAKNTYINSLSEKYCNIKVVAMPIEATIIGNIKTQMKRG